MQRKIAMLSLSALLASSFFSNAAPKPEEQQNAAKEMVQDEQTDKKSGRC